MERSLKTEILFFARITPCTENGKIGYVQFLPSEEATAFGSTEFIVLRSRTVTPEYVYLLARSDAFRDHAMKSMSGATGRQRVQIKSFDNYLIAQPDFNTLIKFSEVAAPIFRNIQVLGQRNFNLRRTRDMLLPKLISGELDVSSWVEGEVGDDERETVMATAVATANKSVREPRRAEPIDVDSLTTHSLWE